MSLTQVRTAIAVRLNHAMKDVELSIASDRADLPEKMDALRERVDVATAELA